MNTAGIHYALLFARALVPLRVEYANGVEFVVPAGAVFLATPYVVTTGRGAGLVAPAEFAAAADVFDPTQQTALDLRAAWERYSGSEFNFRDPSDAVVRFMVISIRRAPPALPPQPTLHLEMGTGRESGEGFAGGAVRFGG